LKALAQGGRPRIDRNSAMFQDGKFPFLAFASLQADVVLRVRPVDPDEGRKFNIRMRLHDSAPAVIE
jgi:hypothetical protein